MRTRLLVSLLLGLALTACQTPEAAGPGVAVVDMERIMRDSEPGKACGAFLEAQQRAMQEKLDVIQNKLEAASDNAEAKKQLQMELQSVYMSAQQRMQTEQQNAVSQLFDTVQRVINDYRTEKGYAVILRADTAAAFDPAVDVTSGILQSLNRQKLEFTPVTSDAAPSEAKEEPRTQGASPEAQPADKAQDKSSDKPADIPGESKGKK